MSAALRTGWSGWPVALAPLVVRADRRAWSTGARPEFTYRDLGLARASGGAISARHVRRVGRGLVGFDWHCHDADLQFNYVIRGSAAVESEHGESFRLAAGDAICEPALHRVRELDFSEDYECIQITVPAQGAPPILGLHAALPARARELDPARRSAYAPAPGGASVPRDAVRRHDLGTAPITGGRLLLSLVEADGGYRTEAAWLVVLGGSAEAGPERIPLRRFDAVSLGAAAEHPLREVAPGAATFTTLELALPAHRVVERG